MNEWFIIIDAEKLHLIRKAKSVFNKINILVSCEFVSIFDLSVPSEKQILLENFNTGEICQSIIIENDRNSIVQNIQ